MLLTHGVNIETLTRAQTQGIVTTRHTSVTTDKKKDSNLEDRFFNINRRREAIRTVTECEAEQSDAGGRRKRVHP